MDVDVGDPRRVDGGQLAVAVVRAVGAAAGGYLLAVVLSTAAYAVLGVESRAALRGDPGLLALVTAVQFAGFLGGALAYLALRDDWDVIHYRRPVPRDLAFVVGGLVVLYVAQVGVSVVVVALSSVLESAFGVTVESAQHSFVEAGAEQPRLLLYMIPVSVLLVGPGEELLFRGVVQGVFRRAVGVAPAILAASLLFGLPHLFAVESGNPWVYVLVAASLGVVLGSVYEYTESILVPAVVHGLWNAALFASEWYRVTGAGAVA